MTLITDFALLKGWKKVFRKDWVRLQLKIPLSTFQTTTLLKFRVFIYYIFLLKYQQCHKTFIGMQEQILSICKRNGQKSGNFPCLLSRIISDSHHSTVDRNCDSNQRFICSQLICSDNSNCDNNNNNTDINNRHTIIAIAVGILVGFILVFLKGCLACKCSKRKEEKMSADENPLYGIYQLNEAYERQYSTNDRGGW